MLLILILQITGKSSDSEVLSIQTNENKKNQDISSNIDRVSSSDNGKNIKNLTTISKFVISKKSNLMESKKLNFTKSIKTELAKTKKLGFKKPNYSKTNYLILEAK